MVFEYVSSEGDILPHIFKQGLELNSDDYVKLLESNYGWKRLLLEGHMCRTKIYTSLKESKMVVGEFLQCHQHQFLASEFLEL